MGLYLFDDFQVSTPPETRRPDCETLLDVFTNIAIDEGEHVKTMQARQDYARIGARVVSPHMDGAHAAESREKWVRWAAESTRRRSTSRLCTSEALRRLCRICI